MTRSSDALSETEAMAVALAALSILYPTPTKWADAVRIWEGTPRAALVRARTEAKLVMRLLADREPPTAGVNTAKKAALKRSR